MSYLLAIPESFTSGATARHRRLRRTVGPTRDERIAVGSCSPGVNEGFTLGANKLEPPGVEPPGGIEPLTYPRIQPS